MTKLRYRAASPSSSLSEYVTKMTFRAVNPSSEQTLAKRCIKKGEGSFHLIGTNSFHVKATNEKFIALGSRYRQNLKFHVIVCRPIDKEMHLNVSSTVVFII